uniref:CUE domain-containing protein n=1 Tax=Bactrocera latifrons TaxID=174628 RepID=A0A0K8UTD1_BACLA
MTDAKGQYQKLPPGWDCKYDQATGNCYYINYFTKAMQLEDPRGRYKQLQNERCSTESIAMQPINGSPYHVYPSNNLQAVRAFQAGPGTNTSLHNMSSSPLLSSRGNLELSPLRMQRGSLTQTPRLGNMSRRSTIQETSFTNPIDTDAVVNKIQNMFPTASEDHIRLLLKKYYNREAVVISALQVEKHPVTMPGPYVTPPAQRHLYHSNTVFHLTPPARRLDKGITARGLNGSVAVGNSSRTASPLPGGRFGGVTSVHGGVGSGGGGFGYMAAAAAAAMPFHQGSPRFDQWRSSPKPHSSPKMKLRYLKTIFPKADEMVLLDILASSDNNVQTASEKLISMGYTKRDFIPPKISHRSDHEAAHAAAAAKRAAEGTTITLQPKIYTAEEKTTIQAHMKEKFPQLAERIILMALESVNYAEDRAIQILYIVQEEDELHAKKNAATAAAATDAVMQSASGPDAEVILGAADSMHGPGGAAAADDSAAQQDSTDGASIYKQRQDFKSIIGRITTSGHSADLAKGADESLLLADYVTWNGANPDMPQGNNQKQLAQGPDAGKLSERSYTAIGRNPELCKGAQKGLAKGSIYAQLAAAGNTKTTNIKCN